MSPLSAPPLAGSPLERGLAGADDAIERARPVDPLAAQRAYAFELRARQQAAAGDVSGALASSSLARAAALSAGSPPSLEPARPISTLSSPFALVPLVGSGVVLPSDLLDARAAIERAAATRHDSGLALAKATYRYALDAYLSGDIARARRNARIARALATRTKGP